MWLIQSSMHSNRNENQITNHESNDVSVNYVTQIDNSIMIRDIFCNRDIFFSANP